MNEPLAVVSLFTFKLKVLESYFSIYFLMQKSILYAKIAKSKKNYFFSNSVLNIIQAF